MENDYEKQHKDHVENTYTEDGAETVEPYAQHTLKRQLKNRHIAMISIGGVIGIVSFYKPSHKLQENSFINRWYVIDQ
jgi:amino acid permease